MSKPEIKAVKVLDKGYLRLEQYMGSDLAVVNAARASYARRSVEMAERDHKLMKYLVRHEHESPFRHCALTVEIKAPIMVMNQWTKYIIGAQHGEAFMGHNEMSRRYVTEEVEFYEPKETQWKKAPENSKQGSGGPVDLDTGHAAEVTMRDIIITATHAYETALKNGVCAEQARLYLPAYALYTKAWSTFSLQAALFLVHQRLNPHAQWEIRQYARALYHILKQTFPLSLAYWCENQLVDSPKGDDSTGQG